MAYCLRTPVKCENRDFMRTCDIMTIMIRALENTSKLLQFQNNSESFSYLCNISGPLFKHNYQDMKYSRNFHSHSKDKVSGLKISLRRYYAYERLSATSAPGLFCNLSERHPSLQGRASVYCTKQAKNTSNCA